MADQLNQGALFASGIYSIKLPQFLDAVRAASDKALQAVGEAPGCMLIPHRMSGNYSDDPTIQDFRQYVAQTAYNILASQGYAMQPLVTAVVEMWTQEHLTGSDMPAHVHPGGMQMCAFYFLDCPDGGSQIAFHDPRPGKCAAQLLQADMSKVTPASDIVLFTPEPGTLMLANSWLPHSFTRNGAATPVRFVHLNIAAFAAPVQAPDHEVEVV